MGDNKDEIQGKFDYNQKLNYVVEFNIEQEEKNDKIIERETNKKQRVATDKQINTKNEKIMQNVYSTPTKENKLYSNISNNKNNIQINEDITKKTQIEKDKNKADNLKSKSHEKIEVKKYIHEQNIKISEKNNPKDNIDIEKKHDMNIKYDTDNKMKKEESVKTWRFNAKSNNDISKRNISNIKEKGHKEIEIVITNRINNIGTKKQKSVVEIRNMENQNKIIEK